MEAEKLQALFDFCKILLDEERLRVIGLLALKPGGVKEIAAALEIKEPLVARHLARLVEAELARQDEPGLYRLDLGRLLALKKELFSLPQPAGGPQSEDEKILRRFVKEERLVQIPVDRSKLVLVLEWLVAKFEPGVRYPERAVNELIGHHHSDFATLRRLLIDYGYMEREQGVYWRVEGKSNNEL